ncbi:MAG: hypothetical protein ACE5HU_06130 [Acidobacteriota bacterium]
MSPEPLNKPSDVSKGRFVGFVALAALLVLVAVAFFSGRGRPEPSPSSARGPAEPGAVRAGNGVSASQTRPTQASGPVGEGGVVQVQQSIVALSPQARLLAERYRCVCGCNDVLATCTCSKTPGSHEMKKYLQHLVDEGKNPADIEAAMTNRFGQTALP